VLGIQNPRKEERKHEQKDLIAGNPSLQVGLLFGRFLNQELGGKEFASRGVLFLRVLG